LNGRVIKVKSWSEFRELLIKFKPKGVAYNIEQGIPARNLTSVRLILPVRNTQYVFIDSVAGDKLRKMGIPLSKDKLGNLYIKDENLINFVRSQTGLKDLKLYSYWSI